MSGNYPPGPPNQPYGQQPGPYGPPPGQGGPPNQGGQGGQGYGFGPFAGGPGTPSGPGGPGTPSGPGGPGGPGGPYGGGPGGPGGPYQPYGPGPQGPPPKKSKLPIIIAAAAVALVLLVTGIVFAIRQNSQVIGQPPTPPPTTAPPTDPTDPPTDPPSTDPPTDPPSTDPPTDPPSTSPTPTTPTQGGAAQATVVANFLKTIAAGNANAAMQYAARPQQQEATMTNAVLAEARKRAPISAIKVTVPADANATRVQASYRIGSTPITANYSVVNSGGAWRLSKITNDISVAVVRHSSVPMRVNGAEVKKNTVRLFPGSYAFTTGSKYMSYGNRNVITVRSPGDLVVGVYGLRRQLTPSGITKVRAEAKKSWNACLDTDVPRPRNCPFKWTNGQYQFFNGDASWTRLGSDPFKKARTLLDATRGPALTMSFRVRISGGCRFDGNRGTCRGTVTGTAVGKINLTRSPLKFDWF